MPHLTRRHALAGAIAGAFATDALADETVTLPFGNGERPLVAYPGKRPLIRMTSRPPQLETPFALYDTGAITPNDAFFVRYHLADIPFDALDAKTWTLQVGGAVKSPLRLSLADLKKMPTHEIVAVSQCSGNGRGFFEPRVPGGQAGNGLMGCARWRGVRLRDVLDRAGLAAGAVQVRFDGADGPVSPATPDFAKALDLAVATGPDVMLAWSMNNADLPVLNGYPLRLVVPGYYATYWLKHLNEITVLTSELDNFWMKSAYRIPDNDTASVPPGTAPTKTRPIGRMNVRSFITNILDGAHLGSGETALRGIAFDGGSGIARVQVSTDDAKSWQDAKLGEDLGPYAFRTWQTQAHLKPGATVLKARAVAKSGEVQPLEPRWNPSGYMRNVVESVHVTVA
jgi:sulfite dehydrogenase (cytochrome) subunit A